MSSSLNKITLIGWLGKDPQKFTYGDQKTGCNCSIAIKSFKKVELEVKEKTDWFNLTFFDKKAEIALRFLKKGKKIYVEGPVSIENWVDENQAKRTSVKVIVSDFIFMDNKNDGLQNGETTQKDLFGEKDNEKKADIPAKVTEDLDDIPF